MDRIKLTLLPCHTLQLNKLGERIYEQNWRFVHSLTGFHDGYGFNYFDITSFHYVLYSEALLSCKAHFTNFNVS